MENRKLLNIELCRMSSQEYKNKADSGLVLILDNIRSAHNVGSAFRSGDSFGIDKIYLCGICSTPPNPEIHKSALGAEDAVNWEKFQDTKECIKFLKNQGYQIICLEQTQKSLSLEKFTLKKGIKYAFVFGNEVDGVDQDVVNMSDLCLEIPQFGSKHSLNVSVSIGVALWHITYLQLLSK